MISPSHPPFFPGPGHHDAVELLNFLNIFRDMNRIDSLVESPTIDFVKCDKRRFFTGGIHVIVNVDGFQSSRGFRQLKGLDDPLVSIKRSQPVIGVDILVLIRGINLKVSSLVDTERRNGC